MCALIFKGIGEYGFGGYVLPAIVSGQAGKNFVEYTLGQKGVAQEAARILMKKVR